MTTVGALTTDLGPGNNRLAGKGCMGTFNHAIDLGSRLAHPRVKAVSRLSNHENAIGEPDIATGPSGNNVPLIITTAADDDKTDKLASAPIDGDGPIGFLAACSKLDMEPNPFEQSFSGSGTAGSVGPSSGGTGDTSKPVLPPIAAMSGPLAPNSEQFGWEGPSLRMGPLSPSMLEGPQDPIMFEKPATTSSLPMGSFPATTAPISTIFASVAPMADASFSVVGMSGPQSIPAGPIQTTAPYPPVVYNQQSMSQQLPQHGPSNVARHPQAFSHTNGQPPMNGRYMSTQNAGAQPADNANGYGTNGIHMLNQGPTTTHREAWVKRESIDGNGTTILQGAATHVQQALPVMPPGMIAAPQLPKNGVEPAFVRGVQKRMASEDISSDDSSRSSKHSNGSNGNEKPAKKRPGVEEKMDDEEKRKNFLERNRQAALKCRQRKKQWLTNLQAKVEYLTSDNEQLLTQTASLRDEIIHLKALLLAHKDCAVAQANGVFPDTISGSNNHAHNGNMLPHGRTPSHSMQGPPGQNLQQQRGSRGSLPSQMQTGGARMPMSSGPTGINGQASVRY